MNLSIKTSCFAKKGNKLSINNFPNINTVCILSILNQNAGSDVNGWARILKAQLVRNELQAWGLDQCHGQQSTAKQQRTKRGVSERGKERETKRVKKKKIRTRRREKNPTYARWYGAAGVRTQDFKSWMLHWGETKRDRGRGRERGRERPKEHAPCTIIV